MSLKPVRSKHKRNSHPRLQGGQWGYKYQRKFDPSVLARTLPKLAILGLILSGIIFIPLGGYYYFQVAPNQPPPNLSHDPFTTLWNGEIPSSLNPVNGPTFDFINGPPGPPSGILCSSCTSPQTTGTPSTVITGEAIIVEIDSSGSPSLTVTDSQSNTYTSYSVPTIDASAINTFTAIASASGSVTWTVTFTGTQSFVASFFGYKGVSGFQGFNSFTGTVANSGSNSLSPTVTSGFTFGHIEMIDRLGTSTLTSGGTKRQDAGIATYSPNFRMGSADESSNTDTWTWGGSGSACNPNCAIIQVVLSLLASPSNPCQLSGYKCFNSKIANGDITQLNTTSSVAVALTNSSIDLSTGAAKALSFSQATYGLTCPAPNCNGLEFGWFLTINGTLTNSATYSPTNDTSVALAEIVKITTNKFNFYVYMQRQVGQKFFLGSETPGCSQTSVLFICTSNSTNSANTQTPLVLNYTGGSVGSGAAGESYLCVDAGSGATTCNFGGVNNLQVPLANTNLRLNFTQPWLNLQNNYYVGFWQAVFHPAQAGFGVSWATSNNHGNANNVISVFEPNANTGTTVEGGFFGWVGRALGGAWNAAAGALSPITSPILGLGNSMLAVFVSGLIQAGNLLIKGMAVLESVMVLTMNAVGNFIGWGNVGTSMQQLINSMVTLFTNGSVSTFFGDLPTVVSRFIDFINITVPWLPIAFNTASNVVLLGVNGIVFIPTLVQFTFFFVSGIFVTVLFVFWFIYTGDDALGGILAFLETAEWFIFGLGVGLVSNIVNFFLDVVTYLIGLIPKPLVQMVAHGMPRLPIVQTGARFVSPSFDLGEIRSGNMLSALSWIIGLTFICWYESVTPALPGSIGGLLPAAAPTLVPLATLLPLLEILTALVGVAALVFWPLTRAMEFLVGDLGGVPVSLGPGRRLNAGPSGISVRKAEKRFQGRLEKKIAERKGFEATERQIKEAGASSQGVG